jgi:flagellar biosynthesis/type III secretory pathway protein FliH
MATKTPKTYMEAEVQAYKERQFREHQREISEARQEAYAEGFAAGCASLQEQMRKLLGLKVVKVETQD